MKTRIEKKSQGTILLANIKRGHLFVMQGGHSVYQRCVEDGEMIAVHGMIDYHTYERERSLRVIPVTCDDLVDGEWRVKDRQQARAPIREITIGSVFCFQIDGDVHQRGIANTSVYHWNISNPTCGLMANSGEMIIRLERTGNDADGTLVFTEL